MKISVILSTARDNYPMIGLPNTFIFEPTLSSLENQDFRDFELVICDALYNERKDYFENRELSFPIRHIPPKPSVWDKAGAWRVCNMLNTAISYCRGELIVRIDDCSSFNPGFLKRFWRWYRHGYFAQALVVYHHGTRPLVYNEEARKLYHRTSTSPVVENETYDDIVKKLDSLYKPGEIIKDSRWRFFEGEDVVIGDMKTWFYGYGSFSLEAALKVNGFDEKFDGSKSLEEVDLGSRFSMAGFNKLIMDESLTVIEHFHNPLKAVWYKGKVPKCNYGLYQYNSITGSFRANESKLSLEDCKWIRHNVCKGCNNLFRCRNEELGGMFYNPESELFDVWLNGQSVFNLKEVRDERLADNS